MVFQQIYEGQMEMQVITMIYFELHFIETIFNLINFAQNSNIELNQFAVLPPAPAIISTAQ